MHDNRADDPQLSDGQGKTRSVTGVGYRRTPSKSVLRKGGVALATALMLFTASLGSMVPQVNAAPGQEVKSKADGLTDTQLVQALIGDKTEFKDPVVTGKPEQIGTFSGFTNLGKRENGDNVGSGLVMSTGLVNGTVDDKAAKTVNGSAVPGPNKNSSTTGVTGGPGSPTIDAMLAETFASPAPTKDSITLDFDFKPKTTKLSFDFIFASDEYTSYVGTYFNDAFALVINGTNCATVGTNPATGKPWPVSVNSINPGNSMTYPNPTAPTNENLYRDNATTGTSSPIDTGFNGMTVVLSCKVDVTKDAWNHARFVIADVSDSMLDSGVFIPGGSFSTTGVTFKGTLYNDANRDGQIQPTETGIANQDIGIYDETGKLLAKTQTKADGTYETDIAWTPATAGGSGTFYVRPAQVTLPSTGGAKVDATQTYGKGESVDGSDTLNRAVKNTVDIECALGKEIREVGGKCDPNPITGAEPAVGNIGDVVNKANWPTYAKVVAYGDNTATADFGYAAAVDVTKSTLVVNPSTVELGQPITATVTARDSAGQALAGVEVTFYKVDPNNKLNVTPDKCTTLASGSCEAIVTATEKGTYQVGARVPVNGTPTDVKDSPATVTFGPKTPFSYENSYFTISPTVDLADSKTWVKVDDTGTSYYTGTLNARNDDNEPIDVPTDKIAFAASSPDIQITSVVPGATKGQYTVHYSTTKSTVGQAAQPTASLKYDGQPVHVQSDKNTFELPIPFKPGDPSDDCTDGDRKTQLTVSTNAPAVGDPVTATMLVSDKYCNPVPDVNVNFSVGPETGTAAVSATLDPAGTVKTGLDGTAIGKAVTTMKDEKAETVKLTAVVPDWPGIKPKEQIVTFHETDFCAPCSTFEIIRNPGNTHPTAAYADEVDFYTGKITAKDQFGNLLKNESIDSGVFQVAPAGSVDPKGVHVSAVTNNGDGTYTVKFTSRKFGDFTVSATYHGKVGGDEPMKFVPKIGDCGGPDRTQLKASTQTPEAGQDVNLTTLVTDIWCVPVPGVKVNMTIGTGTQAKLTIVNDVTDAKGEAKATLNDKKAEPVVVTSVLPDFPAVNVWNSPMTITYHAGEVCVIEAGCDGDPEHQTRVEVTTNDSKPGGNNVVTAYAYDKYGNPKEGAVFDIAALDPKLKLGAGGGQTAQITTGPDGTGTLNVTSDTGGEYLATAKVKGVELTEHGSPMHIKFLGKPVITSPHGGDLTKNNKPEIKGTGSVPGYEVVVTDGGKEVCKATVQIDKSWSCTPTTPLSEGPHTIVATENNKAGKTSDPSDPVTFTVDSVAPKAPVITDPKGDKPINNPKPPISGTGDEPGNTITVRDGDNPEPVCTTTVLPDKTWTCTPTKPLADGEHPIRATETDKAGNESGPSNTVKVVIDTVAPRPPVVDPTNGSEIDGKADPGTTITVTDDQGKPVPGCVDVPVDKDGKFSCTPEKKIDPDKEIKVTSKDPAGNVSEPTVVKVRGLLIEINPTVLHAGDDQVVTGRNFNPGEKVTMTVKSETYTAEGTADAQGVVTFKYKVPAGFTVGDHTATLTGPKSGSIAAGFKVIATEVKTGGEVTQTAPGGLAGLAVLMLLAGAASLGAARVRSRKA